MEVLVEREVCARDRRAPMAVVEARDLDFLWSNDFFCGDATDGCNSVLNVLTKFSQ